MDRTPVIAGIGLSDYPVAPHLDGVQHHVLAAQRAIADCGVAKSDIDGYVGAGGAGGQMLDDAVTMAEYLRIKHRYLDGTMTGGSSFEFDLVGLSTLEVPSTSAEPVAHVELALVARFAPQEGFLGIQAQLTPQSYVLSEACKLQGGFAFFSWFGGHAHAGDFVITLGGFGSMGGALTGGLLLGVIEALGMHFTNPSLKALLSYAVFIGVLLWRPNGLFAKR